MQNGQVKRERLPDLIWINKPLRRCLHDDDPIYLIETDLLVVGATSNISVEILAGHCEACNRWYGLMSDLHDLLDETGWEVPDISGFGLEGRPLDAGVYYGPEYDLLSWQEFRLEAEDAQERATLPAPSAAEVSRLGQLPEQWELIERALAWVQQEDDVVPAFMAIVVDGKGKIRAHSLQSGRPHDADELALAVRRATAMADDRPAGRPETVRIADSARAAMLHDALLEAGIPVMDGETPAAEHAIQMASGELSIGGARTYFARYDASEINRFFKAARAFYRARPWMRFKDSKFLAFQLEDEPWRYANIMGQLEEEPGISIFAGWLQVCLFIHNQPDMVQMLNDEADIRPVDAAGGMEAVSLSPVTVLHPEDGILLDSMGIRPLKHDLFPLPTRFTSAGLTPPSVDLPAYSALLEAVVALVKGRRESQITSVSESVQLKTGSVNFRYPARGDESVSQAMHGFRLVVSSPAGDAAGMVGRDERIEVDAPASALLSDVAVAIEKELKQKIRHKGFGEGEFYLWSDRAGRGSPSPCVADLQGRQGLWLEIRGSRYPLAVMPRVGEPAPEVHVVLRRTA